jgi:hypothetical protein
MDGLDDRMSGLSDLKRFKTLRALSAYVANQKRFGKKYDVDAVKAQARLLKVQAENPADALEIAFWNRVVDYENILQENAGRTVKAQYTRRAVKASSVKDFLTGLMRKGHTQGWKLLQAAERTDASYETVIVEFPDQFDEDVVYTAQERLKLKNPSDPQSGNP